MKLKLIYIISDIDRWQAFEWIAESLDATFDLTFVLINHGESYFSRHLKEKGVKYHNLRLRPKIQIPVSVYEIYKILKKQNPDIVHCHFLDANLSGLIASWIARIPKRVYTRHHSVFHHRYKPFGVYYDRLSNFLSTDIIAISKVVEDVLVQLENVPFKKVHLIHHGFKLESFAEFDIRMVHEMKILYELDLKSPIIGVISRFEELKGIQYIIPAFKGLLETYPNACLVIFNAKGDYSSTIFNLLEDLPVSSFRKIAFEKDIQTAYKLFDVFLHVPIDKDVEAFGQIYIEALASGLPSIFTPSGIAQEFITNGNEAILVPFKDSNAILIAMIQLLEDKELRDRIKKLGMNSVNRKFGLSNMISELTKLYKGTGSSGILNQK